jgi:hypothetical protein
MMWLMDHIFKYTNFGIVSLIHGDFFIRQVSGKCCSFNVQTFKVIDYVDYEKVIWQTRWLSRPCSPVLAPPLNLCSVNNHLHLTWNIHDQAPATLLLFKSLAEWVGQIKCLFSQENSRWSPSKKLWESREVKLIEHSEQYLLPSTFYHEHTVTV